METTDDALGLGGGGGIPSRKAAPQKRTAEPVEQLSEQAKRNRKRARSLLTREFQSPRLGMTGLLGLGEA